MYSVKKLYHVQVWFILSVQGWFNVKKKKKNTTQSHCDSPHLPKKGEEATQNMQKKVDEIK